MKIRTKLIASFIVVAAICAAVGGMGILGLNKTTSSVEEIGVVRLPSVQSLQVIKLGGLEIRESLRTMLNMDTDDAIYQMQIG